MLRFLEVLNTKLERRKAEERKRHYVLAVVVTDPNN
jgi:hypothetical protein